MADEGADLTNGPSTSKGKRRAVSAPSPRSPQIKRKRMPAEYYQSDVVDAISKQATRTPVSDKEVVFNKNTFLAVRTDNGKFFVCKTAQNVYQTTKMFKILWLELRTSPGTYEMSYRDTIDIDSVLTDVVMNRQAGGLLSLPRSEIARVDQILGLAIKKENGMLDNDKGPRFREMKEVKEDDDDDDDYEDEEDEDDEDTDEDQDDADKPSTSTQTRTNPKVKKSPAKKPKAKPKTKSASPKPAGKQKGRGRPKATVTTKTATKKVAKKITAKAKSTKGKTTAKTAKSGRKPLASKDKKATKAKAKKKKVKKEKPKKEKKPKVKLHPNDKLTPNTNIEVMAKDPMFEVKNESEIPEVSKFVQCKRSIRAVLTNDMSLLKKLVDNKDIASVLVQRSASVPLSALHYAVRVDNQAALKLLIPEIDSTKERARLPEVIMQHQQTGRYNFKSLGHAVREINVGRGSREGNNAFTKDLSRNVRDRTYLEEALSSGVSEKTINMIMLADSHGKSHVQTNIVKAITAGHRKLAGCLIEKFNQSGGLNCNKLHEQVLLLDKPEDLSPFRAVSVKKKPYDNDRVTPLHCAAINPNPKILAKLLLVCPEYAITDSKGRKPIHYAAACEGSGPLELLLSRGMNPDETDNKAMTPLMVAALYGRQQNIEVLLKKIESGNTDELCGVKRKSATAEYAIHYATKAGHVECVKSLIKHGADIEAVTSASTNRLTPLMVAAQSGHFQVAKALIDVKAIIAKKDKIKRTALMLACMNGHYPVATLLLRKGADPNDKDSSGNTPVHYAAAYGWWHCLKLLLKAGGDPNILNDWKTPPLGVALMKGHTGCADLLLEQPGVSLNFRNDSGATLVMLTAASPMTKYMVEQMKYLIKKKADLTLVDIDDRNALHYLAAGGMPDRGDEAEKEAQKNAILDVAKLLMEKGCDATVKDKEGKTPINLALQQDNFCMELVQLFLDKGCSLSLDVAGDGDNALHIMATRCTHNDLGVLLPTIAKTFDKQPEEPMEEDDDSEEPAKKKKVISLEEAAKTVDKHGQTPLLRCIIANFQPKTKVPVHHRGFGYRAPQMSRRTPQIKDGKTLQNFLSMFKALIEVAKSDVNAVVVSGKGKDAQQCEGASPLHLLSLASNIPALTILLKAKPKLDILDKGGFTPLQRAILHKRQDSSKLLIEAGANVNLFTASKRGDKATPLILAARAGLHDLIPILVAKGADVSAKDSKYEMTALHCTTIAGHDVNKAVQSASVLIQAGASVNSADAKQRTPLHYSVNSDTGSADTPTEMTEFLIEKKANVFVKDIRGRLPLHYAFVKIDRHRDNTQTDPIEIVTVLLDAMKAQQVDTQDKFGQTPLHWAAYRGATISAMHLAERIKDYNVKDNNGNTPLGMAALGGNDSVAIMLIQKGANINTTVTYVPPELEEQKNNAQPKAGFWQWKALVKPPRAPIKASFFQAVVWEGWQGVVYLMMDRLQKFGLSYINIIQAILEAQKFQLASTMIRKQRDAPKLQQTNRRARSLLHLLSMHAVSSNWSSLYEQIAKSLFDRGVKLFARDDKGCTPLHYAAANQNLALCKIFAERDASGFKNCLNCQDHRGRTPAAALFWNFRFDSSTEEVIRLFIKSGASLNFCTALPNVESSSLNRKKQAESLEAWYHGPLDWSIPRTPLILHMYIDNFKACKFLLKNGASCNYADKDGLTPLMHAVKLNEMEIVKLLLDHDFDPEKDSKRAKPKKQEPLSVWATNIWEQKKSQPQQEQEDAGFEEDDDVEEDEEEDDDDDEDDEVDSEDEDPEEREMRLAEKKAKEDAKKKAEEAKTRKFVKTSDLDVNAADSSGRTAIHHAMKTCSYGTWENVELLQLLVQQDAKTRLQDKQGKTPLDYATETKSQKMAGALQRLQGIQESKMVIPKPLQHTWTDGLTFTSPKPDFKADSQAMLKQLEAEKKKDAAQDKEEDKILAKVDDGSGITEGGVVLIDEEQEIPYDATLTKVDVKYGNYGMNNYYIMQIIHQTGKDMMLLFTRWGRIGDEGQYQKTPFNSKEEAIKEFQKIFKAKTGNDWSKVEDFHKVPKKYQLVKTDPWRTKRKKAIDEFKFNLESSVPSKLPQALQAAIKALIKPELLSKALSESGIDTRVISLGTFLSRDILLKAQELLGKISDLIEKSEEEQSQIFADVEKHQAIMEEVCDLSNEYFELIPNLNFAHDKISPLTDTNQLNTHIRNLDILLDLATTNMILLGAQYRVKEINPLDYIYQSLGCQIRLMKEDDQETQLLLQYIHKTSEKEANVEAIFRLSREGEEERLQSSGVGNHKLLWHGSTRSNVISIMNKGLLIAPEEAEHSGYRFGKGIYSSDAFAKSIHYCEEHFEKTDTKFMFLCEVALGKMITNPKQDGLKVLKLGYDSVMGRGNHRYKYNRDLLIPSGAVIPLGKFVHNQATYCFFDYNEYVVYKTSQVSLRYLVQCKGKAKQEAEQEGEDPDDYSVVEYKEEQGTGTNDEEMADNDEDDDGDDYDDDDDDDDDE
ncbi:poly [ADP-ribose] polymerase tankyrase-like [Patiria miniata]|uniref:Poly [ADP-ribose] polymerase n=1 Tax=Patiria miniata TaxID=46514 RepID=A0A914BH45_PATMI|nr:poly [ADP-ribose] polymerase tankyrase-like [Patiria miniata]XP_038075211.1 poly [ADP-ribose] polymerase tankyrase-like [Patiria miniata]